MENYLLISDAAKEVSVESHVLRYWEEELHLPIKRNELGHRYYTKEDVERFRQIKNLKEKGLQLKAIKMILKDGKLNVLPESEDAVRITGQSGVAAQRNVSAEEKQNMQQEEGLQEQEGTMGINIVNSRELVVKSGNEISEESREEKAKRLQWLLRQLISDTLRENNQELCREIKESVVKELDYQFRNQEEREEERERIRDQRNEEYYKKMDELLRKKSRGRGFDRLKSEKKAEENPKEEKRKQEKKRMGKKPEEKGTVGAGNIMAIQDAEKKAKKKRHSIF